MTCGFQQEHGREERLSDTFLMSDLGPLDTLLDLRCLLNLRASLFPRRTILRIFMHVLVFLNSAQQITSMELGVRLRITDGGPLGDPKRHHHVVLL